MSKTIVVGYDGTEGAKAALEEATDLAHQLSIPLIIAFSYEPTRYGTEVQELRDALRELGRNLVEEAGVRAKELGVTATLELVDDRPAEGIIAVAQRNNARMIVVGSYGERPLTGAILGAVPHKLLYMTDIPVLVVQAPDDE